ncbi:MAG TPA: PilZ domain-containing protein [Steroidobacteraceae bacterium]
MEHRYGVRYLSAIDVLVRSCAGRLAAKGQLLNVSISGAFVATSLVITPLSSVTIEVSSIIAAARLCKPIEAQVIRRTDRGLGIEWKDLTPASLSQLVDSGQLAPAAVHRPASRL